MNFGGITHILRCPNGRFALVGSVPVDAAGLVFDKASAAIDAIAQHGGTYCSTPGCMCRRDEVSP